MGWFEDLTHEANHDPYFLELLTKAELRYTGHFMKLGNEPYPALSEKEFGDLIRFADILCRSREPSCRNNSYKIISLLYDEYTDNKLFLQCANVVLTKLGIFPSLNLLSSIHTIQNDIEISLEKSVKEVCQESPINGRVFTDAQYRLFCRLKNSNHFSFSGPTSFGKSFIIESYIHQIISERNASDNIVILVPTRALINQVSAKLKAGINNPKYRILTHPIIPEMYLRHNNKFIFIFTPERWISYVSDNGNPVVTYMFVDEAHKITSKKDARAPLYYHAILLAERKSVNLYFASPNVPNTEVFLELFEKSKDEIMTIEDSPVAQNRYFVDLLSRHSVLFSDTGKDVSIPHIFPQDSNFLSVLFRFGEKCQNIVYCNSVRDTIEHAVLCANNLPVLTSKKLEDLIKLVKSYVHKDYYLIDCLKHGVAYHFGRLPQRIRERVENLFEIGEINYIFCTSTLLEGVNLPAKNIFILSNSIGKGKFSDIDFWNLAGRAGRFSKELSGNIICVREEYKVGKWDNPTRDLEVIRNKKISCLVPTIIKGEKNFYTNIGNSIKNVPFTNKNATQTEKDMWHHYANILWIHQIGKTDSVLISNFLKKNVAANTILDDISKYNNVPLSILEQSSAIKAKYQNKLWNSTGVFSFPQDTSSTSCLQVLKELYNTYNWKEEESSGNNSMVRDRDRAQSRLQYFSILMSNWIEGKPLNLMISSLLDYYERRGELFFEGKYISFDIKNRMHINQVINNLMSDIDTSLRYKIRNYLLNYGLISQEKFGVNTNIRWVDYVEYGTTDPLIVSLQTLGLPRHLACFLLNKCKRCLEIEGERITDINMELLKKEVSSEGLSNEREELRKLFLW